MAAGNDTAHMIAQEPVLSAAQRKDVAGIINRAREICGLCFGVYVGPLANGRESALAQHAVLPDPAGGVLVALDPDSRTIEIVTGVDAVRILDNRACELAVLAITSCVAAEDLVGGIREGVLLLAERARTPRVWHLDDVG